MVRPGGAAGSGRARGRQRRRAGRWGACGPWPASRLAWRGPGLGAWGAPRGGAGLRWEVGFMGSRARLRPWVGAGGGAGWLGRRAARSGRAVFGRWPRAASSDCRRFRRLRASAPVPGPGGAEPVAPPRVCRWCCWAQEQQSPLLLASRAAEPAARPSPWVAGPGQRAGQNGLGARALGLCSPEADLQARGSFSRDRVWRSMPPRSANSVGHKLLGVVAWAAALAFGIGNRWPPGLPRCVFTATSCLVAPLGCVTSAWGRARLCT